MIININGLSKIEAIKKLIEQKSYISTSVEFTNAGKIKNFPVAKQGRFVTLTSDFYQVSTRPGALLIKNGFVGEKSLTFDYLPDFRGLVSFNFYSDYLTARSVEDNVAYFDNPLKTNLNENSPAIFESYTVQSDGTYPIGTFQLAIISSLPIIIGDQLSFYNQEGTIHRSIVQKARKTQNENQWDVTLDNFIPFVIEDGSDIFVDTSAVQYWESIPLDHGPCLLQLPIATHKTFANSDEIPVSYVVLKRGNEVQSSFYISENVVQIPNVNIPSSAWLSSLVMEGNIDYEGGTAYFKPKEDGDFYSKLNFIDSLDGSRIGSWQFNVNCLNKGTVTIKVNDTFMVYQVNPGLQTLTFDVPSEKINFIDFICDVQLSFGGIICKNAVSSLNLAIHLFSPKTLGSHIIGRPSFIGLLTDSSLVWGSESNSGVDKGFSLKPSNAQPTIFDSVDNEIKKEENIYLTPPTLQITDSTSQDFTVTFKSGNYEPFTAELIKLGSTGSGPSYDEVDPACSISTITVDEVTPIEISAISKANPGLVTANSHGLSTGKKVNLWGIVGMTELNGQIVTITSVNANSFTIGIDTSSYESYVEGGYISPLTTSSNSSKLSNVTFKTITFNSGNSGEVTKLKVTSEKTGKVAIADIYTV